MFDAINEANEGDSMANKTVLQKGRLRECNKPGNGSKDAQKKEYKKNITVKKRQKYKKEMRENI